MLEYAPAWASITVIERESMRVGMAKREVGKASGMLLSWRVSKLYSVQLILVFVWC